MFGSLGLPEILMILVVALLIFGPKRLPEVGRTIGKGLGEFRRASADLKRTVNAELALDDDERPRSTRRAETARAPGELTAAPEVPAGVAPREPVALAPAPAAALEGPEAPAGPSEDAAAAGESAATGEDAGADEPATTH